MKRFSNGGLRAPRRRFGRRRLTFEALEPKRVLDASFGFEDVPGAFVFAITGTDFTYLQGDLELAEPDNIALWSDLGSGGGGGATTNFFVEWVDTAGTWHSMSGSVSAGDIADEAQDRGLQPGDFQGFVVKAMNGEDTVSLNGARSNNTLLDTDGPFRKDPLGFAAIGIRSGAPQSIKNTVIQPPLIGTRVNVSGNAGGDYLFGSPEDDILSGGPDKDIIVAGAGNDNIQGGTGEDQIAGEGGKDTIDGNEDRDLVLGGPGDDIIRGGDGDDGWVTTKTDNQKTGYGDWESGTPSPFKDYRFGLYGQLGNDTIAGDSGNDDLWGDDKILLAAPGKPEDYFSDDLDGGPGADSLLGDNYDKEPEGGTGTDVWQAGLQTDGGVVFSSSGIEKVDTTGAKAKEPTVVTSGYVSTAYGGPFDTVPGQLYSFPDHVDLSGWTAGGTSGVQILTGGDKDILVGSDPGRDRLDAGDGDDTAIGLGNADSISGGEGNDLISGGGGGDSINGGSGNDTATYNEVTIDSKTFPGSPAGVRVFISTFGGSGSGGHATGDRLSVIENLTGSEFGDTLFGSTEANKIDGRGGNDRISGSSGDDLLLGGDGNDNIDGGGNDDALFGEKGNDSLSGGSGFDELLGGHDSDLVDGGLDADSLSGGKGKDIIRTEYDPAYNPNNPDYVFGATRWDLVDLNLIIDVSGSPAPPATVNQGFLFGNESEDSFEIFNAKTADAQFAVMSALASAETLGLSDFENNEDVLTFLGTEANEPPTIEPIPDQEAFYDPAAQPSNVPFLYQVEATDPNLGDVLVYSLDVGPTFMSINSLTGLIVFVPQASQAGVHTVIVRVTDQAGQGLSDTEEFEITVKSL